ncbi:MAG: zinc ribbon domain-containing protein [Nanoarchaeota archaeon]|jgi:HSP20 family molecular chaperone IbpA|nr:zinc ribbon domain-containing protein [Nanoarchaeota archaeon]
MLKKTKCSNCESGIKKSHNFCPNCGIQLKETSQDYGMLGANDKIKEVEKSKLFGGGLSGNIMNKMIGGAIKMIEKEMQKEMSNQKMPTTKIKLMLNGKEISPQKLPQQNNIKKEAPKNLPIDFSEDNLKKWPTLKKEEPKTNLKRIGDKIEYEMEMPGVETIKDISIIKLEKSLEIKAISKENAYVKIIPIDMPLKKFTLLKGKLTLELDASM